VALHGPIGRDEIAEAAGLSPTSSHMGIGLRRLTQRGILNDDGGRFTLAHNHHGGQQ
jgi:hypothetical protein